MTVMTRLFLVRHGEVEGDGVLHGHVDVPLTGRGVAQAEAVAARLAAEPLVAVYSSDLQRARVGADLVTRGRGVPRVADAAFRELDMGEWDGRPFSDVLEKDRLRFKAWWADIEGYALPGGESLAQLRGRVMPALHRLIERHCGEVICLVAHGGVNRVILFDALGLPLSQYHRLAQDYGCLNLLEYYSDGARVVKLVNG